MIATLRFAPWIGFVSILCLLAPAEVLAQETEKKASSEPETVKIKEGRMLVETSLKGVFESQQAAELFIELKAWSSPLIVKQATPHGAKVKKGDLLLAIDSAKIEQALRELKLEREIAEIALRQAREELPVLEQLLPLNLAAAERDKRIAEEDLKRYLEIDRALAERNVNFSVKSTSNFLDYAREELKQLEQMYRDKDLREETEEIILKRQKNQVEAAEFRLETVKIERDKTLNVELPRKDQTVKDQAQKQALAWLKARALLPLELSQKKLALRKLELEQEKSAERQYQLEHDLAAMTVHAPADGVVYHGRYAQGEWNTATATTKLRKNGTVTPNDVFMTIVAARPTSIRATVEEKDLHTLKANLAGNATPTGFPECKLPVRITELSLAPVGAGNFEASLAIDEAAKLDTIRPGMACTIKFEVYRNDEALLAPSSAVFREDDNKDSRYVYLVKDGRPKETPVEVGKTAGGKIEITDGLSAGDEIYTSKP